MGLAFDVPTWEVTLHGKRKRWQFPVDRFVEYEESDERWARPLGFGEEVEEPYTFTLPNAVITGVSGMELGIDGQPHQEATITFSVPRHIIEDAVPDNLCGAREAERQWTGRYPK